MLPRCTQNVCSTTYDVVTDDDDDDDLDLFSPWSNTPEPVSRTARSMPELPKHLQGKPVDSSLRCSQTAAEVEAHPLLSFAEAASPVSSGFQNFQTPHSSSAAANGVATMPELGQLTSTRPRRSSFSVAAEKFLSSDSTSKKEKQWINSTGGALGRNQILPIVDTRVLVRPGVDDDPEEADPELSKHLKRGRRKTWCGAMDKPAGLDLDGDDGPSRRRSVVDVKMTEDMIQALAIRRNSKGTVSTSRRPSKESLSSGDCLIDMVSGYQNAQAGVGYASEEGSVSVPSCYARQVELRKIAKQIGDKTDHTYRIIRNAFMAADADGDGKVTADEVKAFCEHIQLPTSVAPRLHELMDQDANGYAFWQKFMGTYAGQMLKIPIGGKEPSQLNPPRASCAHRGAMVAMSGGRRMSKGSSM